MAMILSALLRRGAGPRLDEERDQEIWRRVQGSDLPIPDWRRQRWEKDPDRRRKALDDLKDIAQNADRSDVAADTLARWWAGGWEPDPGAWERRHPAPPARTVGQWVGWETDPYAAERPPSALGEGFAYGWNRFGARTDRQFATVADALGMRQAAEHYSDDAERLDRAATQQADGPWKYDPNEYLAFRAGALVGEKGPRAVEKAILRALLRISFRR